MKQHNAKSSDGSSPSRSRAAGRRTPGESIDLPLDQVSNDDDELGDGTLGEDEKNVTGGALPASDDGDNDNDHEDVRERERLDHLRRNPAEDDA